MPESYLAEPVKEKETNKVGGSTSHLQAQNQGLLWGRSPRPAGIMERGPWSLRWNLNRCALTRMASQHTNTATHSTTKGLPTSPHRYTYFFPSPAAAYYAALST